MNLKRFIPLCFLLLLLGACSDDAERASLPEVFEAQSIDYFFAEGDGVRTYEAPLDSAICNNTSDAEQTVTFDLTKYHAECTTFSSADPTAFNWCATGDTVWVDDITVSDGQPDVNGILQIPYMEGTTETSIITKAVSRISVPPHTSIRIRITGLFGEVTSSYALDVENIATGEMREIKGKVKQTRLLVTYHTSEDWAGDEAAENATRRR